MKRILSIMFAVVMVAGMASMAMARCNGCGKGKGDGPKGPKGPGDGTCRKVAFGQEAIFQAGGGQNQNQKGKADGSAPGNGEQIKDRECPDGPIGPDCPEDCPGCPDCDGDGPNGPGDGTCQSAVFGQSSAIELAGRIRDRDRTPDGDCDGDGPKGDGDCDGEGPDGPIGPDCPEDCPGCPDCDGPNGPNGPGDGTCQSAVFGQSSAIELAGRIRGRDRTPDGDCDGDGPKGDGDCDGEGPDGDGPCDGDGPGFIDENGDGICDRQQ